MPTEKQEAEFQDTLGIIKAEMQEMDACPNCTKELACKFHRDNALK